MNRRLLLLLPAAGLLAALGLIGGAFWNGGKAPALIYRPLPEFSLPLLAEPRRHMGAEDLRGGLFLVNLWGSWCAPCRAEHPTLMEIAAREKQLRLVGVNYLDRPDSARAFLEELGDPYEFILQDAGGQFGRLLEVEGAPVTFLVDGQGAVRYRHEGPIDERVWERTFKPLIAQIVQ